MSRTRAAILFVAFALSIAMVVAAGERSTSSAGFTELQRAPLAEGNGLELVMGLIERGGESTSGRHHHPGGEFGFVVAGALVVTSENGAAQTLETGDSFYQPPGEWHIVSTGAAGTRTVVFRVVERGQPMVVPTKR